MISIILVNWNGWADTIACIQSLENANVVEARVIVVDNRSSDNSVEYLNLWAHGLLNVVIDGSQPSLLAVNKVNGPRALIITDIDETGQILGQCSPEFVCTQLPIYLIRSPRNGGFGYGCNLGMKLGHQLGTDGFWLLNNDCVITPDALRQVCEHLAQHPKTIFGTELRYYFHPERVQALGGGTFSRWTGAVATRIAPPSAPRSLDFINGASLILTAQAYLELGGFDERIFMYFEENDLCLRAAARGYIFDMIPVVVYHKHGGSQGSSPSLQAWKHVLLNKYDVLLRNIGKGPWLLFFFIMLIVRAISPMKRPVERKAASSVLKTIFKRLFDL
jgi:GT2 family glycosyltransferase